MNEYRVNLDIYHGPLDLLLYLIRREEVDIHDIPIARITEQYVRYVEMLTKLDPNISGEFLVLAATLMEIKTRILLPVSEDVENEDDGLDIDPRADLIRQLLQYKAFKDAAGDLQQAAETQALKFPRRPGKLDTGEDEKDRDLEDVQIWDIFDAFRNVMDAIGQGAGHHEVIYDDTPMELYREDLLDRLERDGPVIFDKIFEGKGKRTEIIGIFLAMLELMKMRTILTFQDEDSGDIRIELNPDPPTIEQLEAELAQAKARQARAHELAEKDGDRKDHDFSDHEFVGENDELFEGDNDDLDSEDFDMDNNSHDENEEDDLNDGCPTKPQPGQYISESADDNTDDGDNG
jgi:segregation and condensation protein A